VKSSKHEKVDTADCAAAQQMHLTPSQQAESAEVLKILQIILVVCLVAV
jgi:hypothetical protein